MAREIVGFALPVARAAGQACNPCIPPFRQSSARSTRDSAAPSLWVNRDMAVRCCGILRSAQVRPRVEALRPNAGSRRVKVS